MPGKQSLARRAGPPPQEYIDAHLITVGEQVSALSGMRLRVLRNPNLTDVVERAMLRDLQRRRDALKAQYPEFSEMFSGDDWDWDYLDEGETT